MTTKNPLVHLGQRQAAWDFLSNTEILSSDFQIPSRQLQYLFYLFIYLFYKKI